MVVLWIHREAGQEGRCAPAEHQVVAFLSPRALGLCSIIGVLAQPVLSKSYQHEATPPPPEATLIL